MAADPTRGERVLVRGGHVFDLDLPFERADVVSDQYYDWLTKNDYMLVKGQLKAAAFLQTFVAYPPSQRPASFNIEGVRREVDRAIDEAFKKRGQQ